MAKTNGRGQAVKDSQYQPKGRKGVMQRFGMIEGYESRSPLTSQLFATLGEEDSYIQVPLATRRLHTTVYNLRQKAARVKAELHFAVEPESKILYAWLTRKKSPSGVPEATV